MSDTTTIVWFSLLLLGCPLSAIYVNRLMTVNGREPGYFKSLAVVIVGFLFVGLVGVWFTDTDDPNSVVLIASTFAGILVSGQIYRVLLRSTDHMVSYGKSVLVAFGSFVIVVAPAFLITTPLEWFGLIDID